MSEQAAIPSRGRLRPVERFLGEGEASGGPFALLGLPVGQCSEGEVLLALEHQLDRVNTHAQCDTPEADEVRLALHAGAAQLLDPFVRRHLIARWAGTAEAEASEEGGTTPPAPSAPRLVFPPPAVDPAKLLAHDAILTLGVLGWNQRSLRRLASLAHARGLSNAQLATALRGLSRTGRTRSAAAVPVGRNGGVFDSPRSAPTVRASVAAVAMPEGALSASEERIPVHRAYEAELPGYIDPGQALIKRAMLIGGGGLGVLVAAGFLIIVMTQPKGTRAVPPAPGPRATSGATGATTPKTGGPANGASNAEIAAEPVTIPAVTPKPAPKPVALVKPADLASVGPDLTAAVAAVQSDPQGALAKFASAVGRLSAGWTGVPHDRLVAAHDSILEFLYRGGSGDLPDRAIEALARGARGAAGSPIGAGDVLPAVWSTGMLVRMTGQKDLASSEREVVDGALAAALGGGRATMEPTFDAGAASMVHAMPRRLMPVTPEPDAEIDPEAWQQWEIAVDALSGTDAVARNRALLAGLETLLVSGPEPNQSRSAGVVIGQLVERITWRAQDESRRALLRWFGDRRMTSADLSAVTSALATKSSAEGIELTMVLSTSASDRVRSELRDRYATVWNVEDQAQKDDLTTAWLKAAEEAVNASLSGGNELDQLERTAVLARLNEAAWLQWRGEGGEAATIVGDLHGPIEAAKGPPPAAPRTGPGAPLTPGGVDAITLENDGGWGEKYLAARQNPKGRKEMLDQLKVAGEALGPVDAEVVMGEAISGTPETVRSAATEIVRFHAAEAPTINAALERLPRVPHTAAVQSLIEFVSSTHLPPVRDPSWPIAARRALIERLVEAKEAEGPMARADRFAAVIALAYRDIGSPTILTDDQRHEKAQPPAFQSATQVWQAWREAAAKMVPVGPPPVRLDEVERRRDGRRSLARGLVQAFAAEQASVAEVMAYVIGSEKPGRGDDVRALVTRLAEDRRRAEGIMDQVLATERAMTQLWILRLKPAEEPPA